MDTSWKSVSPRFMRLAVIAVMTSTFVAATTSSSAMADPGLTQDVASLEKQMMTAAEEYSQVKIDLEASQKRLADIQPQVRHQQALVAEKQKAVDEVAVAAYQNGGGVNQITALVANGSPDTVLNQLTYLEAINYSRKIKVNELRIAEGELLIQREKIEKEIANQADQERQMAAKQKEVNNALARYDRSQAGTSRVTYDGKGQGLAAIALRYVYAQQGKPYSLGEAGPDFFDCSGLMKAAWGRADIGLPHSAAQQYAVLPKVALSAIQPGDLVFYGSPIRHVAMYIGGGKVIHAPTYGQSVQVEDMNLAGGEPPMGAARPRR